MALEDLLRALEREAAEEIRAVTTAAEAEAARIDATAARLRAERLTRAATTAGIAARAAADHALLATREAARRDVLTTRHAFLERARAATRALLPGLLAARADELGPPLLAAALACTGPGAGALRCAPALLAHARAAAPPALSIAADPAITGVVIELATGTRIDATLDALLARAWPTLACRALAWAAAPAAVTEAA